MQRCTIAVLVSILWAGLAPVGASLFEDPFGATLTLDVSGDAPAVRVAFFVPDGHYLYAETVKVTGPEGAALAAIDLPEPKTKHDSFSDGERQVYIEDFEASFRAPLPLPDGLTVGLEYQGCSQDICFLPAQHTVELSPGARVAVGAAADRGGEKPSLSATPAISPPRDADGDIAPGFRIVASESGYLDADDFIAFLDRADSGQPAREGLLEMGLFLMVLTIVAGGLLLNLTPCVLPMIPINLAIIGAGAQASSRARGFALGGVYGAGIALAYGVLGLVVVLTGSTFGALNASPWFNVGIAVVFVVLALAMFDILHIDLTRFRKSGPADPSRQGSFALAFGMGVVAALLAGACVAPVVISVLLASASLYAEGRVMGLVLPFLLGAGMALPWPFAGASLSFLPRPGKWMNWVKYAFGVFILGFALYYAHLGWTLFSPQASPEEAADIARLQEAHTGSGEWLASLPRALAESKRTGKPLFIDFWATWCKNCLAMERTTFQEERVKERLADFVLLKYQAENPKAPDTRPVLERFGVLGLPTYVVLEPGGAESPVGATPER